MFALFRRRSRTISCRRARRSRTAAARGGQRRKAARMRMWKQAVVSLVVLGAAADAVGAPLPGRRRVPRARRHRHRLGRRRRPPRPTRPGAGARRGRRGSLGVAGRRGDDQRFGLGDRRRPRRPLGDGDALRRRAGSRASTSPRATSSPPGTPLVAPRFRDRGDRARPGAADARRRPRPRWRATEELVRTQAISRGAAARGASSRSARPSSRCATPSSRSSAG